MYRFCLFLSCILLTMNSSFAQHKAAYHLFTTDSTAIDYGTMLDSLSRADIILFGELHNNPIVHWLQLELLLDLNSRTSVSLGLEMIERDDNAQFQNYLRDSITHEELDSTARLWNNYTTDYKPIIDSAKAMGIKTVGTNVPRRYASQVYSKGLSSLDTLSANEKSWIAPLPILYDKNLPGYLNMMNMFDDPAHANENLPKAQALKDATMSHFILQEHKEGSTFLHLNGSYHSDNFEGIMWYLKQANPSLTIMTISSKEQADITTPKEENTNIADFLILIPERMIKSY